MDRYADIFAHLFRQFHDLVQPQNDIRKVPMAQQDPLGLPLSARGEDDLGRGITATWVMHQLSPAGATARMWKLYFRCMARKPGKTGIRSANGKQLPLAVELENCL